MQTVATYRPSMTLPEALAENVRALRARRRWTQEELAERLGVTQRTLSRLESGRRGDVGIVELERLCAVFGVDLAELLDGADLRVLGL